MLMWTSWKSCSLLTLKHRSETNGDRVNFNFNTFKDNFDRVSNKKRLKRANMELKGNDVRFWILQRRLYARDERIEED